MAQDTFLHERLYRGEDFLEKIKRFKIVVCGAGALGGNLVENLARQGFNALIVIDKDRIEPHNINTQPYSLREVGQSKAKTLAANLFRSLRIKIEAQYLELTRINIENLLRGVNLVIDTFDNSASRELVKDFCQKNDIACLHAGMSGDGYGEVKWNKNYLVPKDVGEDICDYPLARNLATFIVNIASEVIIKYVSNGFKENYCFTLGDIKITKL